MISLGLNDRRTGWDRNLGQHHALEVESKAYIIYVYNVIICVWEQIIVLPNNIQSAWVYNTQEGVQVNYTGS